MFDHLRLQRWPFSVVPDPHLCDFMADREQFQEDLEKLLRNLSRQNSSSIHPIWSWFGAGKTHTLHFIANRVTQMSEQGKGYLQTIYTEFPSNPRSFVDIYKIFVNQLDKEMLTDAYLEVCTSHESNRFEKRIKEASPEFLKALNVLAVGELPVQEVAMRWLRSETQPIADLRRIGIYKQNSSSEVATRVLIAIVRLFGISEISRNRFNSRLIWLLDELQRIKNLPQKVRNDINTGLHSTFNACPTGFSMILSFSSQPTNTLPAWFSPEIKDRIGRTKFMILPPMQTTDALKFVRDILEHSRMPEHRDLDPYFPFEEITCHEIIENIKQHDELKPRAIMQVFNEVLQEADYQIEIGNIRVISREFAIPILEELVPQN